MSGSREGKAIQKCSSDLEKALVSCERELVYFLCNEGFINKEVCDDVLSGRCTLSSAQKAGELVKGIRDTVLVNPEHYSKLVEHLKDEGGDRYQAILKKLDAALHEQERSCDVGSGSETSSADNVQTLMDQNDYVPTSVPDSGLVEGSPVEEFKSFPEEGDMQLAGDALVTEGAMNSEYSGVQETDVNDHESLQGSGSPVFTIGDPEKPLPKQEEGVPWVNRELDKSVQDSKSKQAGPEQEKDAFAPAKLVGGKQQEPRSCELNSKLAEKEKKICDLERELETTKSEKDKIEQKVLESEKQYKQDIAIKNNEINKLKREVEKYKRNLSAMEKTNSEKKEEYEKKVKELEQELKMKEEEHFREKARLEKEIGEYKLQISQMETKQANLRCELHEARESTAKAREEAATAKLAIEISKRKIAEEKQEEMEKELKMMREKFGTISLDDGSKSASSS